MRNIRPTHARVAVIGGGFTGLSAAYELAKAGVDVVVLEAEAELGGLAAAFDVGDEKLDRFYHHWFTNDIDVMGLIDELGLNNRVIVNQTNTGIFYANQFFKLSTPLDLLKFTPLSLKNRIRLGLLVLRARKVTQWLELEDRTAAEWLKDLGGEQVYKVVWEPLLKGKFGPLADQISAVWFWNKLKLRGGSRGRGGEERLAYFRGGFVALVDALAERVQKLGGKIALNTPVKRFRRVDGYWHIETPAGELTVESVIATPALPLIADMVQDWASDEYKAQLRRIHYIANVCLVLELKQSLSKTYWLNVNDPNFPFVAVIEHTNFEKTETYGDRHIVYLSKYLPHTDKLFSMSADELLEYALPHLQRMFPEFQRDWIILHHVWKARWSQPIVEKHYTRLIPSNCGPADGMYLASMAQIYPEDRGTNYAIREGRRIGKRVLITLS